MAIRAPDGAKNMSTYIQNPKEIESFNFFVYSITQASEVMRSAGERLSDYPMMPATSLPAARGPALLKINPLSTDSNQQHLRP